MPRMTFGVINARLEDITGIKQKDDLKKHSVQRALDIWADSWNWKWLLDESFITTVAPDTTGTASVAKGSKSVTGSGTSWTSAMVGRKIRFNGENAYYRISAVGSGTAITLEAPYQGTTDADATLSIYQDEYLLAPDLARYKIMRQIENGVAMEELDVALFDYLDPMLKSEGDPYRLTLIGSKLDTYSDGTLSASSGTSVLTGSSTSWTSVNGLARSSRITIGTNVYTVKSVDSDTQITIYETLSSAISGGTSYSISLDNLRVQTQPIPDSAQNIYYRYQRIPAPLIQDTDVPDMPEQWHWFLIDAAKIWLWETKDKDQAALAEQSMVAWLKHMRLSESAVAKRTPRLPFTRPYDRYQPPIPGGWGRPFTW